VTTRLWTFNAHPLLPYRNAVITGSCREIIVICHDYEFVQDSFKHSTSEYNILVERKGPK